MSSLITTTNVTLCDYYVLIKHMCFVCHIYKYSDGEILEEKLPRQLVTSSTVMYNFGVGPRFAFVSASARAPK